MRSRSGDPDAATIFTSDPVFAEMRVPARASITSLNPAAPSSRSRTHDSRPPASFGSTSTSTGASPCSSKSRNTRIDDRTAARGRSSRARVSISNSMPRRSRFRASGAVMGRGGATSFHATGELTSSNHRPTPLLPAGNATSTRGRVPERSSRCAATGPARTKLLMLFPSSMRKASGGPCADDAAPAPAPHAIKKSEKTALMKQRIPVASSSSVTRRYRRTGGSGVSHHAAEFHISVFSSSAAATAAMVRATSFSLVRQLVTLMRIARRPFHVVPLKNASPPALILAITSSLRRS